MADGAHYHARMQSWEDSRDRPAVGDVVVYLIGVAGLTAAITLVFLSMRAVMDIGGMCGEGGPYVIQTHCPEGVPLLMTLSFPALFLFGGLMLWRGGHLGGPFAGLVMFAWPALFLSLGWNFLEYAFRPPGEADGVILGWLIPGVLFVVMGGVPLIGMLLPDRGSRAVHHVGVTGERSGTTAPSSRTSVPPPVPRSNQLRQMRELRRSLDTALVARAATLRRRAVMLDARADTMGSMPSETDGGSDVSLGDAFDAAADDLVSQLERLAALQRTGALTLAEFDAAKQRIIAGQDRT